MVKTPCFRCRGHGFNPWSGNKDPACHVARPREKKIYMYIKKVPTKFHVLPALSTSSKNHGALVRPRDWNALSWLSRKGVLQVKLPLLVAFSALINRKV